MTSMQILTIYRTPEPIAIVELELHEVELLRVATRDLQRVLRHGADPFTSEGDVFDNALARLRSRSTPMDHHEQEGT